MKKKWDKIYRYLVTFIIIFFVICGILSYFHLMSDSITFNLMLILLLSLFSLEFFYYIFIEFNLILALFIPTIVLFLMGRPLILLMQFKDWSYYGNETTTQYLYIIFITILGIIISKFIPSFINTIKDDRKKKNQNSKKNILLLNIKDNRNFTILLTIFLCFTFSCYVFEKISELFFMSNKTYLDFYLGNNIELPWIVTFLSSLNLYFMCFYLAYVKNKTHTIIVLLIFILTTLPNLVIGQRNPFILSVFFSIVVVYIKNMTYWRIYINKKKTIISLLIIGILLSISMVIVSTKRNGKNEMQNLSSAIVSFVYDQGNTYETLCIGISHKETLRNMNNNNYTFSATIDYFKYGKIGNVLFDTKPLPGGNNVVRSQLSNDLAHKISYLALKNNYLKGAGIGTTYVLETYLDFGYIGVFLINIFYVLFFHYSIKKFGKNIFLDNILIFASMKIFFVGRDSAMIPFSGLITVHYLFVLFLLYATYFLLNQLGKKKLANEE